MTQFNCPHCGSRLNVTDSRKPNKPNRFKTFESTQPDAVYDDSGYDPIGHSFWDSYAIRYIITGCFICLVFVVFNWAYDWGLAWIGAILAIVAPLGLHLWTIYKMAPPKPEKPKTIRVETHHKDSSGYKHINIDDTILSDSELDGSAKLIKSNTGWSYQAAAIYCKVSPYRARTITTEMKRLGYLQKKGNKHYPTESGESFAESMNTGKGIAGMVGEIIQK